MLDLEKLTLSDIINGYFLDEKNNSFVCIHCGRCFEIGEIFKVDGRFFEAPRAVKLHIEKEHKNRLNELIDSENKYLSLTDNQKELFTLFGSGLSDSDIAKQLKVTPSTIRHQRFIFREKAKSAKLYLAVWELVSSGIDNLKIKNPDSSLLPLHGGAKMVDERYVITEEENKKIMEVVFESLEPLKLKVFSAKEKKKIVILRKIAEQFEKNRQYSEKEVNGILSDIFDDFVTLRRYLIEYGYMDRTRDCKTYWLI